MGMSVDQEVDMLEKQRDTVSASSQAGAFYDLKHNSYVHK